MKAAVSHMVSLVLPITVLVIVPMSIESQWIIQSYWDLALGILLGGLGLGVMYATIASFVRIGKGTLAPWAPTRKLVIFGLYRYVRNPMILGVLMVLLAEAVTFTSFSIFQWAIIFVVINTLYFILFEEPGLEKRFGEEYREYKKHVNRWWPRSTPYQGPQQEKTI